ncbi:LOW QUALITY PROTEIN: probable G-protein coupled receptor 21 [Clinocottus analis]|uniref:LOW QUALITY PROTEIN: probable G-protein coupled receptor 21 n=1 Tax=Clinocottus analis TaxID=304258 RepID=UPI0035C1FF5F
MNSSSEANQSAAPPFCLLGAVGYSRSLDTCVLEVAVILFLTVLIISGNLVVISVFHCAPLLHHHATGHFIQTMAYADLLVGVSCLAPSTCKAFGYAVSVLKSVSMASLACISVDRYVAVTRPLSYATLATPCRLRACIVLVWVYSALVFLPSFFGWGKPGYHGDIFRWCAESWTTEPGFSAFIVVLLYAPAALIVCFTYGSIFRICRQHTREITQRHARFSSQTEGGGGGGGGGGERCEGCPDRRYAMVLFRITSVFYVLWMPYILYFLLESAGLYRHQVASFLTTWLAISNSFCNCLIYSLSNSVFRKGLGRLFSPLLPACLGCADARKAAPRPEPRRPV